MNQTAVAKNETMPIRELKPVSPIDLVPAESRRLVHCLTLQPGMMLEDLLLPDSWSVAAPKLHRRDLVEVEPVDGSWWALLLVAEIGTDHATLILLHKIDFSLPSPDGDLPLGHGTKFLGPKRLWCALRGNQVLKHGFTGKSAAAAWLNETLR